MSLPPLPFFPGSFWFEMLPAVRGVSASIPGLAGKNPFNFGFGVYKINVAHSALGGIRTYPHGTNYGYGLRGYKVVSSTPSEVQGDNLGFNLGLNH